MCIYNKNNKVSYNTGNGGDDYIRRTKYEAIQTHAAYSQQHTILCDIVAHSKTIALCAQPEKK